MSCGLSFGVVPFVSKRSTGLVSGFTGAGGNAGGAVTQAIFFTYASYGPAQVRAPAHAASSARPTPPSGPAAPTLSCRPLHTCHAHQPLPALPSRPGVCTLPFPSCPPSL